MKKVLVFLFLLASVFLLTGCGDEDEEKSSSKGVKTLTCKATVSGLDTTVVIEYNTKKSEIKSAKATYIMDLSNYSETQIDALKETDFCSTFEGEVADKCETEFKEDSMVIDVKMNIEYMVDKEFGGKENVSLEDIQKGYENNLKATCTVK